MVPVPPEPEAVAAPSFPPLQVTLVEEEMLTLTGVAGWVMMSFYCSITKNNKSSPG